MPKVQKPILGQAEKEEWCTIAENNRHGFALGLIPFHDFGKGQGLKSSKLKNIEVLQIKQRLRSGDTCADIARCYGVGRTTVSAIKRGVNWNHI